MVSWGFILVENVVSWVQKIPPVSAMGNLWGLWQPWWQVMENRILGRKSAVTRRTSGHGDTNSIKQPWSWSSVDDFWGYSMLYVYRKGLYRLFSNGFETSICWNMVDGPQYCVGLRAINLQFCKNDEVWVTKCPSNSTRSDCMVSYWNPWDLNLLKWCGTNMFA